MHGLIVQELFPTTLVPYVKHLIVKMDEDGQDSGIPPGHATHANIYTYIYIYNIILEDNILRL